MYVVPSIIGQSKAPLYLMFLALPAVGVEMFFQLGVYYVKSKYSAVQIKKSRDKQIKQFVN